MADELITIEIDGAPVKTRPGRMLIEVTDEIGCYVPRFCYHHKLSVAANCRMCLVEVEKAPKPLPACATPATDGMKVMTRSDLAREAQQSVMEFLLINHPLDCPICDQGGECELQDLAMGYGRDVSRYQEKKRVVQDQDIGPLVQTDMTRCIHCTRCVRFGEEIAGLRELGTIGRSEFMEIGTYVEQSMASELSGNVIDLCPVGALTSKPFRYSARAWEMTQHDGVAPHDAVGSNVHFHVKNGRIKRTAPAENEAVNEVWLSDRDRFSYEGLYADGRLAAPMVKDNGDWRETDWETALSVAADRLRGAVARHGADWVGALASPQATLEELYLAQKFMRGLGSNNIDHRLRQADFSDQDEAPAYPGLGMSIADVEQCDAVLIVGGFPRKDQPLLNHRLRRAALGGARIMALNPVDFEFNYEPAYKRIVSPAALAPELATVLREVLAVTGKAPRIARLLGKAKATETHAAMARALAEAERPAVFIGPMGMSHPQLSWLRRLGGTLAQHAGGVLGYLPDGANSAGAWLAGAVPHRKPGGASGGGLTAAAMLARPLAAFLLLDAEPDFDFYDGGAARAALAAADCVTAVTGNRAAQDYADVLLPLALPGEKAGSYLNAEGRRQDFAAAAAPVGASRPAWEIFQGLARRCRLAGFDYPDLAAVQAELAPFVERPAADNMGAWQALDQAAPAPVATAPGELYRVGYIPMNSTDALVRRAPALQRTADTADDCARINAATAARLELNGCRRVKVTAGQAAARLPLHLDDSVADGCVLIHGASAAARDLGPLFGPVTLSRSR